MIISRSPLRISLGGGGTDVPSYYRKHGGYLIAGAITKYVYISVMRPFNPGIYLKYSELEEAESTVDIKHPIIREVVSLLNLKTPQLEITSLADIPAGTGLGSSGSFTTALIKAIFTHYKKPIQTVDLAEMACEIELNKLNEPVGKQDQYIAAFGGITQFTFNENDTVSVSPLNISMKTLHELEDNLLLFFTGQSRSASRILSDQNEKSKVSDSKMLANLNAIKELGVLTGQSLLKGDLEQFACLLSAHWQIKRERSIGISNSFVDQAYEIAMKSGGLGGKLVGAGGGGFLMIYASDSEKLRHAMKKLGMEEVRFNFDFEGTKILMT